jgi:hypothetical protein
MPYRRRALYLQATKPSGPNLLDEPWKDFIVKLNCPMGSHDLGLLGITTHSESVQPLQSVKPVYQPCSRSWAALDPYGIEITINLLVLIFIILFTWSCVYYGNITYLLLLNCLKHDQLKATWSKPVSTLFELHEPHVIFVEYFCAHPCIPPHLRMDSRICE